MTNDQIAEHFTEVAELLESQGANQFRVGAYRQAAENLRSFDRQATDVFAEQGIEGLQRLPGIGRSLAHAIEVLLKSGRLTLLERLRGDTRPERIFSTVDVRTRQGQMVLCGLSRTEQEILKVTRLDRLWSTCASRDEAISKVCEMDEPGVRS